MCNLLGRAFVYRVMHLRAYSIQMTLMARQCAASEGNEPNGVAPQLINIGRAVNYSLMWRLRTENDKRLADKKATGSIALTLRHITMNRSLTVQS